MPLSSPPTIPMHSISIFTAIREPILLAARSVPCVAAVLLADGEREHAEQWAEGQPFFAQHAIPAFRPQTLPGSQVTGSFCSACASLRCGIDGGVFEQMAWAVDHRGRAMPIDAAGPLAPSKHARDIDPMPEDWTEQVQLIADAFHASSVRQRREPTTRIENLTNPIAERTTCTIPVGVFLSGSVAAGCGFGVARDDHPKLTIDTRDLTSLVEAICERLTGSSE